MSRRNHWCSLGGLYLVVRAPTVEGARTLAWRAFRRAGHPRAQRDDVRVRRATRTDMARWAELQDQETRIRGEIEQAAGDAQPGLF